MKRKSGRTLLEELTSAGQIPVVDGELELGSEKCLDTACVAFRGRRKKEFRAQPLEITVSLGTIMTCKHGGRGILGRADISRADAGGRWRIVVQMRERPGSGLCCVQGPENRGAQDAAFEDPGSPWDSCEAQARGRIAGRADISRADAGGRTRRKGWPGGAETKRESAYARQIHRAGVRSGTSYSGLRKPEPDLLYCLKGSKRPRHDG